MGVSFSDHQSIFQSPLFGAVQQKIPYRGKTFVVEVSEGKTTLRASAVRILIRGRWSWLWIPYGATVRGGEPSAALVKKFFTKLQEVARAEKAIFVRVEPGLHTPKNLQTLMDCPTKETRGRFTPDHTLVLDLSKTEGELLAQMKPKGRYNIKVAEKNGVTVTSHTSLAHKSAQQDFDAWYAIMRETGERDGFGTHGAEYYKTLIKVLNEHDAAMLFVARDKEGTVIAGSIVTFFDGVAMYYYGASHYRARNLMAPYAVQWGSILDAKKRGSAYYDFLGISPPRSPHHAWRGVTEFKKKFGGQDVVLPPAFDIVYRKNIYRILRLIKKVR